MEYESLKPRVCSRSERGSLYAIHIKYLEFICYLLQLCILCHPVIFTKYQLLADSFDLKAKYFLILWQFCNVVELKFLSKLSQSGQFEKLVVC